MKDAVDKILEILCNHHNIGCLDLYITIYRYMKKNGCYDIFQVIFFIFFEIFYVFFQKAVKRCNDVHIFALVSPTKRNGEVIVLEITD